jgi:hypothetical protein
MNLILRFSLFVSMVLASALAIAGEDNRYLWQRDAGPEPKVIYDVETGTIRPADPKYYREYHDRLDWVSDMRRSKLLNHGHYNPTFADRIQPALVFADVAGIVICAFAAPSTKGLSAVPLALFVLDLVGRIYYQGPRSAGYFGIDDAFIQIAKAIKPRASRRLVAQMQRLEEEDAIHLVEDILKSRPELRNEMMNFVAEEFGQDPRVSILLREYCKANDSDEC